METADNSTLFVYWLKKGQSLSLDLSPRSFQTFFHFTYLQVLLCIDSGKEADISLKKSDSITDLLPSCNYPLIVTHFHVL